MDTDEKLVRILLKTNPRGGVHVEVSEGVTGSSAAMGADSIADGVQAAIYWAGLDWDINLRWGIHEIHEALTRLNSKNATVTVFADLGLVCE